MGSVGEIENMLTWNETYIEEFCDDNVAPICLVENVIIKHRLVHVAICVLWIGI